MICLRNISAVALHKGDTEDNNNNNKKKKKKIPEQHTEKAQNQGTTENSHLGHCTLNSDSNILKYNTFNM
jgi:hypothetical protein